MSKRQHCAGRVLLEREFGVPFVGDPCPIASVQPRSVATRGDPSAQRNQVPRADGAQLRPLPQRYDAVDDPLDLSAPQGQLCPNLHADRPHYAGLSDYGVVDAAADRPLHRRAPHALFAVLRHGFDPARPPGPRLRAELRDSLGRRRSRWHGLGGLSPGGFAHRTPRIRGQHGLAQSIFQVGGNAGSAAGPLIAATIIIPFGPHAVAWIAIATLVGITLLWRIGTWYKHSHVATALAAPVRVDAARPGLSRKTLARAIGVLLVLLFSKYFYLASLTSYYTFYLISRFHATMEAAQLHIFIFLFAVAAGALLGGPIGDR